MREEGGLVLAKKHSVHQTQWAAQFAVASELCKRDYQVAFTMGNHPQVDLMVISPKGMQFVIDVKGLYQKNFWLVSPKMDEGKNLYYVFAFVPKGEPNQFFILSHAEVKIEVSRDIERARANRTKKGLSVEKVEAMPGVPWTVARRFENQWGKLPE